MFWNWVKFSTVLCVYRFSVYVQTCKCVHTLIGKKFDMRAILQVKFEVKIPAISHEQLLIDFSAFKGP